MNVEKCQRCNCNTNGVTIMSMFNTDVICLKCKDAEMKRSDYADTVKADIEQIKKGNFNFGGIGFKK